MGWWSPMTSICFKFRGWSHKPARVCCWKSVKFMFVGDIPPIAGDIISPFWVIKNPTCVASISLEGRFSHDSKVLHPSHVVFSAQNLQGSRWIPSRRASSTLSGHTKWGGTARSSGYCQVSVWVKPSSWMIARTITGWVFPGKSTGSHGFKLP